MSLFSPCFLIFSFLSFSFLIFHFSLHYLLYFFPSIFIPLISLLFTLFVPLFLPCFSFFLWWVCLGQQPNAHPAFPPLPNRKQGEERMKNLRVEIKTWRLLTTYSKRQNRVNLMKIHLLPIKKYLGREKGRPKNFKKQLSPFSLISGSTFLFHSPFFYLSHTELHTQSTTAPLCYFFLLTVFVCSSLDALWATPPSGNSQMSVSCSPLAAVQIPALVWLSTACKRSSALVHSVPPSFLLLWPWCSHHCSTLCFLPSSSAWVLVLPFLKCYSRGTTVPASRLCPAPQPEHCHEHLFILCFHLRLFPFPLSFIFWLSHLLSLLPISSSLFFILLSVSSLFLSCPPHLHPITSCSDKRIIFLLKQKYKRILNLFYEARTVEIPTFNFSFVHFYSKPKEFLFSFSPVFN